MKKTAAEKHEAALRSYMVTNQNILETLRVLTAAAEDHFGVDPDEVNWTDAASLDHVRAELNNIARFLNLAEEE